MIFQTNFTNYPVCIDLEPPLKGYLGSGLFNAKTYHKYNSLYLIL